jgi:anti-sigma factor RsiW
MRRRRRARGIACAELVELVTAYLDHALDPAERAGFEEHLDGCADCTAYVAQFAQTIAALGALPGAALDEDARETLLGAFRDFAGST